MKRARDVRDQLVGLMERVELEMESSSEDHDAIKKVGHMVGHHVPQAGVVTACFTSVDI